ncbi:hypothetical protein GQ600_12288 [Phytophthora cactorum]|nr:hypothetical protein GQ600_12288 [Phytophthora cactorum]
MGPLRTRTESRRAEKQLLLRHNGDDIVKMKQDVRKEVESIRGSDGPEQITSRDGDPSMDVYTARCQKPNPPIKKHIIYRWNDLPLYSIYSSSL